MITFDEALADPVKEPIINVEITPREQHLNWVATSGATNVWEVAWVNFVNTDSEFGGLHREISNVIENVAGLTQQVSVAAVSSNAGSWYLDEATALLHVHTKASTSPDVETVVYSEFIVRFSTEANVLDGKYYEPRIASETQFSITDETGDLFFGNVKSVASGSMSLINGDGMFDSLGKSWGWVNAPALVKFGFAGLTSGQFIRVGTFEIEDIDPGRQYAVIPLRNIQKETHRVVPFNTFDTTTYPNMDEAKDGSRIPLLFGAVENITPVLVDSTVEKGLFVIADAVYQGLASVPNVYVDGVAVSPSDLNIVLGDCTFEILATFSGDTPSAASVTCDATGPAPPTFDPPFGPGGIAPYVTSTDYLKKYGELAGWLYTSILDVSVGEFDSAAALTLDSRNTQAHASYIDEIASVHDIIRDIERGVLGLTRVTLDGLVSPTIFIPAAGAPILDLPLVEESGIIEFQPDLRIQQIFSKAVIQYNRDPTGNKHQTESAEDAFTKFFNLRNRLTSRTISTVLKNTSDAAASAQVAVFMSRNISTEVLIDDVSLVLFASNVGDRVRLTVDRAPSIDGAWANKVMDIRSIIKVFTPVPHIEVILSDLQGIDVVGGWSDDDQFGGVPYVDADSETRAVLGYWSDDDGFVDPPDTSSQNIKVWWT